MKPIWNLLALALSLLVWDMPASYTDPVAAAGFTYKYYINGSQSAAGTLTSVTCTSAGSPVVVTCQATFPTGSQVPVGADTIAITIQQAGGPEGSLSTPLSFPEPGQAGNLRIK